jgi:hypothetical protein
LPKEKVPKERAPDILAHSESLWVPCDARMSRRGANSLRSDRRTPEDPAHPVLLGKPGRGFRIKIGGSLVGANSFAQVLSE